MAPAGTVSGYRVYYGNGSRSYLQVKGAGVPVAAPALTLANLPRGATYYFAVTALDPAGVETDYSAEVSKTIP